MQLLHRHWGMLQRVSGRLERKKCDWIMKSTAPLIAGGVALIAAIAGFFLYGGNLGLAPSEPTPPPAALTDQAQTSGDQDKKPADTKAEKKAEKPAAEDKVADKKPAAQTEAEGADKETVAKSEAGDAKDQSKDDTASFEDKPKEMTGETAKSSEAVQEEAKKSEEVSSAKKSAEEAVASGVVAPSFDVVRVEPDGNTLVAGRAAPGAIVELRNGDEILSRATADANGEWVMILDQLLKQGVSDLSLAAKADEASEPVLSTGSVTVALPKDGKGELLVIETKPGQASEILALMSEKAKAAAQETEKVAAAAKLAAEKEKAQKEAMKAEEAAKVAMAAEEAKKKAEEEAKLAAETAKAEMKKAEAETKPEPVVPSRVAIEAVELEGDTVFAAGAAQPAGSLLRLYIDNKPVADTKAGETGRFLFDSKVKLAPGQHSLRVDMIGGADGAVMKRAEVTFNKQSPVAKATPVAPVEGGEAVAKTDMAAANDKPAENAVPAMATKSNKVIIRRGDNLWEIARRVYGAGIRYSTIFDSNNDQIRDPHWIYPGQVFQLPEGQEGWESNYDAVEQPTAEGAVAQ